MSWDWVKCLSELRTTGTPVVMVTVSGSTGSTPREVGAKMLVKADGTFFGTIGGGQLEHLAIEDAKRSLMEHRSNVVRYPLGAKTGQCCGGVVELFFEVLHQGPRLYVFGAGHVGQAVCRTMSGTSFTIHLVDERADWIYSKAIPEGVIRHACDWDEFTREADWDESSTYAAVMTHLHATDEAIVAQLVKKPARYVGLIGSKSKWDRFHQRLQNRGFTDTELARVKCPMGISVAGKSPQEIAISLAAELIQIHYQ